MTFNVFQFWNGQAASIRPVEVPADKFAAAKQLCIDRVAGKVEPLPDVDTNQAFIQDVLNLIFHYGQNEWQPLQHPSVSVGDIIEFKVADKGHIEFWVVATIGFMNYSREKHFIFRNSKPGPGTTNPNEGASSK